MSKRDRRIGLREFYGAVLGERDAAGNLTALRGISDDDMDLQTDPIERAMALRADAQTKKATK